MKFYINIKNLKMDRNASLEAALEPIAHYELANRVPYLPLQLMNTLDKHQKEEFIYKVDQLACDFIKEKGIKFEPQLDRTKVLTDFITIQEPFFPVGLFLYYTSLFKKFLSSLGGSYTVLYDYNVGHDHVRTTSLDLTQGFYTRFWGTVKQYLYPQLHVTKLCSCEQICTKLERLEDILEPHVPFDYLYLRIVDQGIRIEQSILKKDESRYATFLNKLLESNHKLQKVGTFVVLPAELLDKYDYN
jgi:hypothetical protein